MGVSVAAELKYFYPNLVCPSTFLLVIKVSPPALILQFNSLAMSSPTKPLFVAGHRKEFLKIFYSEIYWIIRWQN